MPIFFSSSPRCGAWSQANWMVISFVCLFPARLLLSTMAVLYHVNNCLKVFIRSCNEIPKKNSGCPKVNFNACRHFQTKSENMRDHMYYSFGRCLSCIRSNEYFLTVVWNIGNHAVSKVRKCKHSRNSHFWYNFHLMAISLWHLVFKPWQINRCQSEIRSRYTNKRDCPLPGSLMRNREVAWVKHSVVWDRQRDLSSSVLPNWEDGSRLSNWVTHLLIKVPTRTRSYTSRIHELKTTYFWNVPWRKKCLPGRHTDSNTRKRMDYIMLPRSNLLEVLWKLDFLKLEISSET